MRCPILTSAAFSALALLLAAVPADQPARAAEAPAPAAVTDPAPLLEKMGNFVGGRWLSEFKGADGKPIVELRFEWVAGKKHIRGSGKIADMLVEERVGWDPAAKCVYYLDSHGPETVYF